jgi:predicted DNA-binding ribbon-helix-helix protein
MSNALMTSSSDEVTPRGPRKRSLAVHGKSTSIFISDAQWKEFQEIAEARNVTANRLVSEIRSKSRGSLGAAIRLFIVNNRVSGTGRS